MIINIIISNITGMGDISIKHSVEDFDEIADIEKLTFIENYFDKFIYNNDSYSFYDYPLLEIFLDKIIIPLSRNPLNQFKYPKSDYNTRHIVFNDTSQTVRFVNFFLDYEYLLIKNKKVRHFKNLDLELFSRPEYTIKHVDSISLSICLDKNDITNSHSLERNIVNSLYNFQVYEARRQIKYLECIEKNYDIDETNYDIDRSLITLESYNHIAPFNTFTDFGDLLKPKRLRVKKNIFSNFRISEINKNRELLKKTKIIFLKDNKQFVFNTRTDIGARVLKENETNKYNDITDIVLRSKFNDIQYSFVWVHPNPKYFYSMGIATHLFDSKTLDYKNQISKLKL